MAPLSPPIPGVARSGEPGTHKPNSQPLKRGGFGVLSSTTRVYGPRTCAARNPGMGVQS